MNIFPSQFSGEVCIDVILEGPSFWDQAVLFEFCRQQTLGRDLEQGRRTNPTLRVEKRMM
jgi:hypothetical protein